MSIPAKVALKEMVKGKPLAKTATTRHEMLEVGRRLINKKAGDVIEETLRIALDQKHPEQMQALKLIMNRVAPTTFYEKLADRANAGNKVNIQINVVGHKPESPVEEAIVVEIKEKDE